MTQAYPIFISYRRSDAGGHARNLYRELSRQFGSETIFFDRSSVEAGDDFPQRLAEGVQGCAVLLALIAGDWLKALNDFWQRRLDDPRDFVRKEIALALRLGKEVVPVLFDDAQPPPAAGLPDDLKSLADRDMHRLRGKLAEYDGQLRKLVELLARVPGVPQPRPQADPRIGDFDIARSGNPIMKGNGTEAGPAPRDASTVDDTRLPFPTIDPVGREEELKALSKAWREGSINVISIIAPGGAGKSALARAWLEEMRKYDFDGAGRVFCWSFNSGKFNATVSSDTFIAEALQFFGDFEIDPASPWANGERLADHVREQRNILILDGLETLQSDREAERGAINDPALATLVTTLADENRGLCIITSRLHIVGLNQRDDVKLPKLPPEAGCLVLRRHGIHGLLSQLQDTSEDFGGHALALSLLIGWLQKKAGSHPDVALAKKIPAGDGCWSEEVRHPYRVLEAWTRELRGEPDLELLYLLAFFNKPVPLEQVADLLSRSPVLDLTQKLRHLNNRELTYVVNRLENHKLISAPSHDQDTWLDAHQLVREFCAREVKRSMPDAWRAAHEWLYGYFCSRAPEQPDTFSEMEDLYEAVAHGCEAGIYEKALNDVFINRIRRSREEAYSALILGAYGADLSAISAFFEAVSGSDSETRSYEEPIGVLERDDKAFVRGVASFSLRAMGRLREALKTRYVAFDASIRNDDWYGASYDAPALAEILLILGDIVAAKAMARLGVKIVDLSSNRERRVDNRATLGDVLHQSGQLDEAEKAFREAEKEIQKRVNDRASQLYLPPGYQYCDLLLTKEYRLRRDGPGNREDGFLLVRRRAEEAEKLAVGTKDRVLGVALAKLTLGQAYLGSYRFIRKDNAYLDGAAAALNEAVNGLRRARQQDLIPLGLVARASLRRERGDFKSARQDLNSALAIARSGSAADFTFGRMKLREADVCLEYARLCHAEAEKVRNTGQTPDEYQKMIDEARKHYNEAKAIIREVGYRRRDVDVQDLEKELPSV